MTTKIENKNKTGGEKRKKTTRMNRNRKTEKQKKKNGTVFRAIFTENNLHTALTSQRFLITASSRS